MKKIIGLYSIIIVSILSSCTKTTFEPMDFSGNLIIQMATYDEFYSEIEDKENIELLIEGLDGKNKFYSDASGRIEVYDLPMGVYNFHLTKESYGEYQSQPIKFIGDTSDIKWNVYLHKNSTIKILNYQAYIKNDSLFVAGTISHNYSQSYLSKQYYPYNYPCIIFFVSESPNVSNKNFIDLYKSPCLKSNPETFDFRMRFPKTLFPSGSTIYLALYGQIYGSNEITYDIVNNITYRTHLGEPSEIKSIVVP